jgi:flavocytochrome c
MSNQIIIVGGGLAGLSAAHTVLEHGGNVLVIEKSSFMGGNSTKATSGINGALTKTQIKAGIKDSVDAFFEDTMKSARELARPDLIQVLTGNSGPAVEWLQSKFKLDLSKVSRLGGHSFPRTHRGGERFPGMTITYALMEKLEEVAKSHPNRARILVKTRVTGLIKDNNGTVIGVETEHVENGTKGKEHGPVVLSTGGYAADFTDSSLLKKYRPDIYDLPTTNGDYSTGDGIKMGLAVGCNAVDLEKVQVHPTGLVDPKEPDAKVKFLAAEALRGVGGLLVDCDGLRFADELGHRDYVTGEMWKRNKGPYRLILNGAGGKEIEWHCKHYMGRGLMKRFESGEALAKEIGVSPQVLSETFNKYNEGAKANKDPFGKKYFHNLPFKMNDEFYVSIVTPVLHFCMGGLEINPECEVLNNGNHHTIPGLFAAGEVAGGVHGANRLGGSSLLGCVVFGRVAGATAARYLFSHLINKTSHGVGGTGDVKVTVLPSKDKFTLEFTWNNQQGSSAVSSGSALPVEQNPQTAQQSPSAAPAADRNKEYSLEEIAKHNKDDDCWVIINGQVLDVTKFLKDHPGGKKAILIYAGRDATEEFNMLHKPDVIEKYAPETVIGRVKASDVPKLHSKL